MGLRDRNRGNTATANPDEATTPNVTTVELPNANDTAPEIGDAVSTPDSSEPAPATSATPKVRPVIDPGTVTVETVEDDGSFGARASRLDTDTTALAVKAAGDRYIETGKGDVVVLHGEPDKIKGIKSIATRASARYLSPRELGINFDTRQAADGVLKFKVGPKKRTTANTPATPDAAPETTDGSAPEPDSNTETVTL